MAVVTEPGHHAKAHLDGLVFRAMRQVILHHAKSNNATIIEDEAAKLSLETRLGRLTIMEAQGGIDVIAAADRIDRLYNLKSGFVDNLARSMPAIADAIRWSDSERAGALPPNFHFATVRALSPIGEAFVRVRLEVGDLSSFADDAIHFRFALPADGVDPDRIVWPRIAENGTAVWPQGEDALHRPVYTTRWLDHSAGLMDVDVFLHEGGRVTNWVRQAAPGAQIAIVGPGGGGIPDTQKILLYADETGFPAAARILESLADKATGSAVFLAENGIDCGYPISAPPGISIEWLARDSTRTLAARALSALANQPDHFLWFASERSDTQAVRATYREQQSDPTRAYIAAYWTKQ